METGSACKGHLIVTMLLLVATGACNKSGITATNAAQGDPANGSLAPVSDTAATNPGNYYSQPGQQQTYSPQGNPSGGQGYYPPSENAGEDYYPPAENDEASYEQPLEASEPPPALPDYEQPSPRRQLHLDSRILVLRRFRLLLGAGRVGHGALGRCSVDSALVGLL